MIDVQWKESKDRGGQAEATVSFLLPGCRKRHLAKFWVMLYPDGRAKITTSDWSLKGVPKRIRDKLGESGLEWLRAECARMFARHGLVEMKRRAAEQKRQETVAKRVQVCNSLIHSFNKALELGMEMSELECLLREAVAKRIMEA